MFRKTIILLMVLASLIICCMGQTFQYSRGWTNGKRSNSNINENFPSGLIELDTEKKLEKCLINLQKILHGMYGYQVLTNQLSSHMNKNLNNDNMNHHHSNEIFDEFSTSETGNLAKRSTILY